MPIHPHDQTSREIPKDFSPLSLDDALLIAALRQLWRRWQERARCAAGSSVQQAWHQAMLDLESVIEESGGRHRHWRALTSDIAREVLQALRSTSPD